MKRIKVIHLPTTVGGNPQGISRHLNEIGVDSETWTFEQNYIGYSADKVIKEVSDSTFIGEIKRLFALSYIWRADVVFYNFGSGLYRPFMACNPLKYIGIRSLLFEIYSNYSSLMAVLEVWLCRVFRVKIFILYQGDDARQGDYCKVNFRVTFANTVGGGYYNPRSDKSKRKSIKFYAKYACKIYALNPDLLHVLPETADFLPYSHISLSEWNASYGLINDRPIRVGHAPSHRGVKGTELIIKALEELRLAGYNLELVLVEGVSNRDAKEIYRTMDVLVDQLFAGWYGGLAVELMALGKPVVAYIRDEDLLFIPEQMRVDLPIIRAEPETIRGVLKKVLHMNPMELLELSRESRAYVERWHDPMTIARRIRSDMEIALTNKA